MTINNYLRRFTYLYHFAKLQEVRLTPKVFRVSCVMTYTPIQQNMWQLKSVDNIQVKT
jgi:hypothetical protein